MITIRLNQEELETLIEVLERTPHNNTLENGLRKDLRHIRKQVEDKRKEYEERVNALPKEETKFISANPTSAEHIK